MRYAITSMYANPIHPGHIECLKLSKEIADEVWVIVNNDKQAEFKRGMPSFQDEQYRKEIVGAIRYVDYVFVSTDEDESVCKSIRALHSAILNIDHDAEIVFTKGGDRFADEIPEKKVCDELSIQIIDKLGEKTHHSSQIIKVFN